MHHHKNWQEVTRFIDEESQMAVILQKDMGAVYPKYSLQVGRLIPNRENNNQLECKPFIPVFLDRQEGEDGKTRHIMRFKLEKLEFLIQDAEEFILQAAAEEDTTYAEAQVIKEKKRQRSGNGKDYGKPRKPVMRQGKTARKRTNKAKREREAAGG